MFLLVKDFGKTVLIWLIQMNIDIGLFDVFCTAIHSSKEKIATLDAGAISREDLPEGF